MLRAELLLLSTAPLENECSDGRHSDGSADRRVGGSDALPLARSGRFRSQSLSFGGSRSLTRSLSVAHQLVTRRFLPSIFGQKELGLGNERLRPLLDLYREELSTWIWLELHSEALVQEA